jgi:ribosomal protein S26
MAQETITCKGCGATVPIPEDLAAKGEQVRQSLKANEFGSVGAVRCPSCGKDTPLVVVAPLDAPKPPTRNRI